MIRSIKTLAFAALAALATLATVPAHAQAYTGVTDWVEADPGASPSVTFKFTLIGLSSLCTSGTYAYLNDNDWTATILKDMKDAVLASKYSGQQITITTQTISGICHVIKVKRL